MIISTPNLEKSVERLKKNGSHHFAIAPKTGDKKDLMSFTHAEGKFIKYEKDDQFRFKPNLYFNLVNEKLSVRRNAYLNGVVLDEMWCDACGGKENVWSYANDDATMPYSALSQHSTFKLGHIFCCNCAKDSKEGVSIPLKKGLKSYCNSRHAFVTDIENNP